MSNDSTTQLTAKWLDEIEAMATRLRDDEEFAGETHMLAVSTLRVVSAYRALLACDEALRKRIEKLRALFDRRWEEYITENKTLRSRIAAMDQQNKHLQAELQQHIDALEKPHA